MDWPDFSKWMESVPSKWVISKVPPRKKAHIYAVRISLKNK
jgi:hypothetical protein